MCDDGGVISQGRLRRRPARRGTRAAEARRAARRRARAGRRTDITSAPTPAPAQRGDRPPFAPRRRPRRLSSAASTGDARDPSFRTARSSQRDATVTNVTAPRRAGRPCGVRRACGRARASRRRARRVARARTSDRASEQRRDVVLCMLGQAASMSALPCHATSCHVALEARTERASERRWRSRM